MAPTRGFLTDAYQASRTAKPMVAPRPAMSLGGPMTSAPPPTAGGPALPGARAAMPNLMGPKPAAPALGGPMTAMSSPAATPAPAAGPANATTMPSLMGAGAAQPSTSVTLDDMVAALRAQHPGTGAAPAVSGMTPGSYGAPGGTNHVGGGGPVGRPTPTPAPIGPPAPPPPATFTPGPVPPGPGPGDPGYLGPGAVDPVGTPGGFGTPQNAYDRFYTQWANNPGNQLGPFVSPTPAYAGNAWLTYILSDPYNRMISDAAEKQTLEGTNTAFDAARGKMRSDALESGASEGGVAKGQSQGLELARGATQAKNVRDFEQYKTDKGDERLKDLLMPYLAQFNNRAAGAGSAPNQGNSSQQYLQYAALIASLFA